ncbi:DUF6634 family protein [Microvirga sp. 2TAF3]|uniref:DUF6634 family protein n=1 Tax=Microvirga sp. 2TAF3 TaxID=3233014 RepID=UPI003F9812D6
MFVMTKERGLDRTTVSQEIDRLKRLAEDIRAIAEGESPTGDDLKNAPILNHWVRAVRPVPCLVGYVPDHPRPPGTGRPVMTSDLWVLAEHQGWARTLSRWYLLGRPQSTAGSAS